MSTTIYRLASDMQRLIGDVLMARRAASDAARALTDFDRNSLGLRPDPIARLKLKEKADLLRAQVEQLESEQNRAQDEMRQMREQALGTHRREIKRLLRAAIDSAEEIGRLKARIAAHRDRVDVALSDAARLLCECGFDPDVARVLPRGRFNSLGGPIALEVRGVPDPEDIKSLACNFRPAIDVDEDDDG